MVIYLQFSFDLHRSESKKLRPEQTIIRKQEQTNDKTMDE